MSTILSKIAGIVEGKQQSLDYLSNTTINASGIVQAQANAYLENIYQWLFNNQPISVLDRASDYTTAFSSNSDVFTCIDKIGKTLVAAPILIYEVVPGMESKYLQFKSLSHSSDPADIFKANVLKAQSLREVNQKDIEWILENPNADQTQTEFFMQLACFFLLSGNGYTYFNGPLPGKAPWTEMFVLPSQFTKIVSGGMFEPVKGYRVDYSYLASGKVVPFGAASVAHIRTFNPEFNVGATQLYGMSTLRSLLLDLAMSKEGRQELVKQAKNGGTLGMLSPDGPGIFLGEPQQKDLEDKLLRIKRSNEAGERLFPSGGPLKYTQIGLPSTELELISLLGVTRDDIYRAYHVPLTFADQKASTYDNLTLTAKQFVYDAVMPIGKAIEDKVLNRAICGPVNKKTGKKYVCHFDYQSLPAMQADMSKLSEWLELAWWIKPDLKLEAMGYGATGLPEMNEIYIPSGMRNIKDAALTDDSFTQAQED